MSRIQRKYLAHFIGVSIPNEMDSFERLGKALEEYTVETSAQVESRQDILGQTDVSISGYEKSAAVESYYCDNESDLYRFLQYIIDNDMDPSLLKTEVVEVRMWHEPINGNYPAVKEDACIEITSYGGDTSGYQIGFKVHYTGNKVPGYFSVERKEFGLSEDF